MWRVVATIAISTLLSACLCTKIGCTSGANFNLPDLPLDEAARLVGGRIEICHNDVCGTAALPAAPAEAGTGIIVSVEDPIHSFVHVIVWRFDAAFRIEVDIAARNSVLVDGDVYTATLTAVDGSVVTSAAFHATSHRDQFPNGERCDDHPCRVAVLEPR